MWSEGQGRVSVWSGRHTTRPPTPHPHSRGWMRPLGQEGGRESEGQAWYWWRSYSSGGWVQHLIRVSLQQLSSSESLDRPEVGRGTEQQWEKIITQYYYHGSNYLLILGWASLHQLKYKIRVTWRTATLGIFRLVHFEVHSYGLITQILTLTLRQLNIHYFLVNYGAILFSSGRFSRQ